MGRVRRLQVQNYRSVRDAVEVRFPADAPLVLVGENNVGKSNVVRALELVLGESWPGSYEPEDHDFYDRDRSNAPIEIQVDLEGVVDPRTSLGVEQLLWRFPPDDTQPFQMMLEDGQLRFVSNPVREQCLCILVGADRRLSYQMSYTSKYTFLSKLMRKFHQALMTDQARVATLKDKFEGIKALFQQVEAFRVFSEELQNQVEELSSNLEYRLQVDFSAYDPSNYFHALRVFPHQGDQVRTFDELGTGQEQILALSFAYAYAKAFHGEERNLVVVIEEPEAHLHPLAQEWVGKKIHDLAREGVQVAVVTHSPAFLDVMGLEGVSVLSKRNDATQVVQLSRQELATYCRTHGAASATAANILPFYAAAATEQILGGLFAGKVVLVEGPTEALALPIYLETVGLNVTKEGIAVIPVHGVGNVAKWWRFFTAYGIPSYVMFDNDASDDGEGAKKKDILQTLQIPAERFDELLNTTEWAVNDNLTIFGVNFEETMRSQFADRYTKLEEEARQRHGLSLRESKPLVARYVAERMGYDADHPGWQTFGLIADRIRRLR